ncbi:hypothetical protein PF008_g16534 [Phytophthora fragariae]|uniref:Uncharacterized protein n=1 Tax=Phytophthora fragariae TaxID=53985 RepID=A0A6G0RBE3_9STRA|nr:hypothetical protein PF008_g16534 [Phytophthora fragariae]
MPSDESPTNMDDKPNEAVVTGVGRMDTLQKDAR